MNPDNFGKNLARIMKERGLTTSQVARKTGVDGAIIYRLVTGERRPNIITTIKILENLQVTFESMVAT